MGIQIGSKPMKEIVATDENGNQKRVYEVIANNKLIYYDGRNAQYDGKFTKAYDFTMQPKDSVYTITDTIKLIDKENNRQPIHHLQFKIKLYDKYYGYNDVKKNFWGTTIINKSKRTQNDSSGSRIIFRLGYYDDDYFDSVYWKGDVLNFEYYGMITIALSNGVYYNISNFQILQMNEFIKKNASYSNIQDFDVTGSDNDNGKELWAKINLYKDNSTNNMAIYVEYSRGNNQWHPLDKIVTHDNISKWLVTDNPTIVKVPKGWSSYNQNSDTYCNYDNFFLGSSTQFGKETFGDTDGVQLINNTKEGTSSIQIISGKQELIYKSSGRLQS